MMEKADYDIGYTSCYIQDHDFEHLCSISAETALAWVKSACPEVKMGGTLAKHLTHGKEKFIDTDIRTNGWTNKLFVIVANDHDKWFALVNWDGRFSIYIEREKAKKET